MLTACRLLSLPRVLLRFLAKSHSPSWKSQYLSRSILYVYAVPSELHVEGRKDRSTQKVEA